MKTGRASKTALRVAIRRAAHQLVDQPPVLDDPIAARLIGSGYARDMERAQHSVARDFRCYIAARSRYVEDRLAAAVAQGVTQYVILGAGLDTLAYRNPFAALRVFEVDFPATQEWKRELLEKAAIDLPGNLTFVPLDFERQTLNEGLAEAGFDQRMPAFFGWMGVTPYLTLEAFRATLNAIAHLPAASAVSFDYVSRPETLSPQRRKVFEGLKKRVAAAGEPFRLFLLPEEAESELRRAGFRRMERMDSGRLNECYFKGRADGLKLSGAGLSRLATAWV
jgi:methyltransferase (TIGR00027 family)